MAYKYEGRSYLLTTLDLYRRVERLNLVALQSIRQEQVTSPSRWNYFFSPVPVPVVVPGAVFIPVRRSSRRSVRAVRRS